MSILFIFLYFTFSKIPKKKIVTDGQADGIHRQSIIIYRE